jgi:hypothetical protein
MRYLFSVATAAALAATLTVVGLAGSARPAAAAPFPLNIVAVGDSYASGDGARGGGWTNAGCRRSSLAGPENAATRLVLLRPGSSFTSFACSGATTSLVLGQLASIPAGRVDALTMSVGGNDIGFAGIVATCMNPLDICNRLDASVTASITTTLPPLLDSVLNAVPANPADPTRANVANVFVTEYPDPTTGLGGIRCGNPLALGFQGMDGVTEFEAAWASTRVVAPLNAALAAAVARANARPGPHPVYHFVTGISARFASHGYCTGGGSMHPWTWFHPRYVNTPFDSLTSQGDVFGTMHPNDLGQGAIGEALFDAMSFLLNGLRFSVSTSAAPVVGGPVGVSASVMTTAGTPVPRANIIIDGVTAGQTDQNGNFSTVWTFSSAGNRTIRVSVDPYFDASATVFVAGNQYTVSSNPSPVPLGTIGQLSMAAHNSSSGQLIPGTFTVQSASGTFTVPSGGSVANVSVTAGRTRVRECDDRIDGRPNCVWVLRTTCPTLTFQPAPAVYTSRNVSNLVACSP